MSPFVKCPVCHGRGRVHVGGYAPFGPIQQWKICPRCTGKGSVFLLGESDDGVLRSDNPLMQDYYDAIQQKGFCISNIVELSHVLKELEDKAHNAQSKGDHDLAKQYKNQLKENEEIMESYVQQLPTFCERVDWARENAESFVDTSAGRGCFIATAVLGDNGVNGVKVLREFRDTLLNQSCIGRFFIAKYERFSPSFAEGLKRSRLAKTLVRTLIVTPLSWVVRFTLEAFENYR